MKQSILAMMNDAEQELLRETEAEALRGLDEDDLLDLHTRVRRARTKYSKLYRRRASAQVGKDGRRSGAHPKHARTALKAEVFEDALARVSRQLSRAAKESADLLKAERIAAAREGKGTPDRGRTSAGGGKAGPSSAQAKRKTPKSKKASASARASTKRAQAAKDGR